MNQWNDRSKAGADESFWEDYMPELPPVIGPDEQAHADDSAAAGERAEACAPGCSGERAAGWPRAGRWARGAAWACGSVAVLAIGSMWVWPPVA